MENNIKKSVKFIICMLLVIFSIGAVVQFGYEKINIIPALIISVIAIIVGLKIYLQKELKEEQLFIYIIPVILIMFLIGIPSLKNPDEIMHWYKIYDISQGNIMPNTVDGTPIGKMPNGLELDIGQLDINYTNIGTMYQKQVNENEEGFFINLSTTSVYNPMVYVPQVLGTVIADIFTDRPLVMMYSARVINLLFSLAILYTAVKIIPFGKRLMILLTAIPVAAASFASMSPDAITIAIAYLLMAYIFKVLSEKEKKIEIKDKVIITILAIVIALCKIVYLPLAGLILLLPKEKYKNRKEQIVTTIIVIGLAILANLIWLGISSQYLVNFKDGAPGIQVQDILANPLEYIQSLIVTINVYIRQYINELFGVGVGADLHIELYSLLPMIIFGIYLFESISDNGMKKQFNTYQKIIIGLILLATIGLIFTSLYVQWTPINHIYVSGVQGRYFLPILPLISFLIGNSGKIKSKYDETTHNKFLRNNTTCNICICNVCGNNRQYVERNKK